MRNYLTTLLFCTAFSTFLFFAMTIPFSEWLSTFESFRPKLLAEGRWAAAKFVIAAVLLMQIGFPRLLVFSLGGFFFGFFPGMIWAVLGSVVGALLTFQLVRNVRWLSFSRRYPRLQSMADRIQSHGIWVVIVLRQLPMSGYLNNILLGMTNFSLRDFFWGTVLGYLPLGAAFCMVGAGLMERESGELIGVAGIMFIISMLLAWWLRRKWPPETY